MTDITIYTSANNGEEVLVFPVVPKNLPEIVQEYGHEEFETNDNVLTLIGKRKRRTMSLSFLLPVNKSYKFINTQASSNGRDYIDFWEKWSNNRVPMRLIITEGLNEVLNIAYTIDSLKWYYDKKKDIVANVDITEYIFTTEQEEEKTEYNWSEIAIKYNGAGYSVKAANVGGHWLVPVRRLLELLGYSVIWNGGDKSIYMTKNGISYKLKSEFQIYEGTSYGYLYQVCNELGYKADWDDEANTVNITVEYNWTTVELKYGGSIKIIKACMKDNRWLVPARDMLEMIGYNVTWNADDKTISIDRDGEYKIGSRVYIFDDTAYYYGYEVCNELGYSISWDRESNRITIGREE